MELFLLATASRPALGLTKPPIPGDKATCHPYLVPRLRMRAAIPPPVCDDINLLRYCTWVIYQRFLSADVTQCRVKQKTIANGKDLQGGGRGPFDGIVSEFA
jgi:hypothetical protein